MVQWQMLACSTIHILRQTMCIKLSLSLPHLSLSYSAGRVSKYSEFWSHVNGGKLSTGITCVHLCLAYQTLFIGGMVRDTWGAT